jgi:FMN phosphatase YigB (HAD superfamily)
LLKGSPERLQFKRELLLHIPFARIIKPNKAHKKALVKLRDSGLKLAILTNGTVDYALNGLEHLGLTDLIPKHLIFGTELSNGLGKDKAPELFEQVANTLNMPAHQLVMLDDKVDNLEPPHDLNWHTVWVNKYAIQHPRHHVTRHLPAWVHSLLR